MADLNRPDKTRLLAQRILDTVEQEYVAVSAVRDVLARMLTALRIADHNALADLAAGIGKAVRSADDLRDARGRQCALLCRSTGQVDDSLEAVVTSLRVGHIQLADEIDAARARIRDLAATSGQLVASFEFALHSAHQINHELVTLVHGLMQPRPTRVYTAAGKTKAASHERSMINQVG